MWGIILIDTAGQEVDRLTIEAPFESMRDWCRHILDSRPDAALARLVSNDGLFDYSYPERTRTFEA